VWQNHLEPGLHEAICEAKGFFPDAREFLYQYDWRPRAPGVNVVVYLVAAGNGGGERGPFKFLDGRVGDRHRDNPMLRLEDAQYFARLHFIGMF
jgi:hypothetical protein